MKLAAADADCKRCLDEFEAARDVQSSLVKELCQGFQWTEISDAWNEDRTCNSNCSERSVQDANCDDSCSSARGGAKERLADRHRRVERSAMRDPAIARM